MNAGSDKVDLSIKIADILKPQVKAPENQNITKENDDEKEDKAEEYIKSANNKFLLNVLSPEIQKKRKNQTQT